MILEKISQADLQNLIDNAVAEGRTIEYKQALPGGTDSEKKEFLADVSSFANTAGGDLLFGISEDKGVPTASRPVCWIVLDRRLPDPLCLARTSLEEPGS